MRGKCQRSVNIKNNYRKIGKKEKEDNDIDVNVAQQEHDNNKYYVSTFKNIQNIDTFNLTSKNLNSIYIVDAWEKRG